MYLPRAQTLTDPVSNISSDDHVIALMGPTGVGKSTFINVAADETKTKAGDRLKSCTTDIHAIRCYDRESGKAVVLIDTPGFDDTTKSDQEILQKLADWLKRSCEQEILLTGIIYLHRITDNRMAGSPLKNLNMFSRLCGDHAISRVILVTTMWGRRIPEDAGSSREKQLCERYWKSMLELGSTYKRFENTPKSAWEVINTVLQIQQELGPVLLQEELVTMSLSLCETEAGKALYNTFQKLLAQQKETLRQLRDAAKEQDDPAAVTDLERKYADIENELRRTFEEVKRLKIPLSRRIMALFRFRRTKGKVLRVLNGE